MSYLSGFIEGFHGRHRKKKAESQRQAEVQSQREMSIFDALANSPDQEVQQLAIAGLLHSAKGPKKKGGLAGWMGEVEKSPYMDMIRGLSPTTTSTKQVATGRSLPSASFTGVGQGQSPGPQAGPQAGPQPGPQAQQPQQGRLAQPPVGQRDFGGRQMGMVPPGYAEGVDSRGLGGNAPAAAQSMQPGQPAAAPQESRLGRMTRPVGGPQGPTAQNLDITSQTPNVLGGEVSVSPGETQYEDRQVTSPRQWFRTPEYAAKQGADLRRGELTKDMEFWRQNFPNMSDEQIAELASGHNVFNNSQRGANMQRVELTGPDGEPMMGFFDPQRGIYFDAQGQPVDNPQPYDEPGAVRPITYAGPDGSPRRANFQPDTGTYTDVETGEVVDNPAVYSAPRQTTWGQPIFDANGQAYQGRNDQPGVMPLAGFHGRVDDQRVARAQNYLATTYKNIDPIVREAASTRTNRLAYERSQPPDVQAYLRGLDPVAWQQAVRNYVLEDTVARERLYESAEILVNTANQTPQFTGSYDQQMPSMGILGQGVKKDHDQFDLLASLFADAEDNPEQMDALSDVWEDFITQYQQRYPEGRAASPPPGQ